MLCSIDGGNLRNAIPREAEAVIGVPESVKEQVRAHLNRFAAEAANELGDIEPSMKIVMETADKPQYAIDPVTACSLVSALYAAPHGVVKMSRDIPGLVETSTNLASVKMKEENTIVVATSQRSSVESEKYDIARQVEALFTLAGAEATHGDGYPGWKPNMNSKIMEIAVKAYEELYQVTQAIKAIHAGLPHQISAPRYDFVRSHVARRTLAVGSHAHSGS